MLFLRLLSLKMEVLKMVRKLFILLSLMLSVSPIMAMDPSWLKGAMTPFKEVGKEAASPVVGAAFLESDDAVRAYKNEGPVGDLMRKIGHVLDNRLRLTQRSHNPMGSPNLILLGELNKAILENSIADYLNEETVQKWFNEYKKDHKNTKGKDRKKFEQTFQEIIELIKKVPKEEAARIISTFAYLISSDAKSLASYAKAVGVELEPQQFTEQELSSLTNNVDQIIAATLSNRKNKTLDFLHMHSLGCSFDGQSRVSICGEQSLWTVVNFMLYNEQTGRLDLTFLPQEIKILPQFKSFIETYPNPQVPEYSELAKQSWMDLVSDVPGVVYVKGNYELKSNEQNALKLLNYLFGTAADSFENFGKLVSSDQRPISMILKIEPATEFVSKKIHIKVAIENSIDSVLDWQFSEYHTNASIERKVNENSISVETLGIIERLKKEYPLVSLETIMSPFFANLLVQAVENSDQDLIHRLLNLNADINAMAGIYAMPLHFAAMQDTKEMAQFLLENGAMIDVRDDEGLTPLRWAVDKGNLEMAEFLLKQGADKNIFNFYDEEGVSALHTAIYKGNVEVAQFLLERGADPNLKAKDTLFPLQWAMEKNRTHFVPLLLKYGADIEAIDGKGETALDVAIRKSEANLKATEQVLHQIE